MCFKKIGQNFHLLVRAEVADPRPLTVSLTVKYLFFTPSQLVKKTQHFTVRLTVSVNPSPPYGKLVVIFLVYFLPYIMIIWVNFSRTGKMWHFFYFTCGQPGCKMSVFYHFPV